MSLRQAESQEPTFANAQRWWKRMRQSATFPGVPGHPFQPAVLWNASLLFCPISRAYMPDSVLFSGCPGLLEELNDHLTGFMQLEFSFGEGFFFPDRMDNTAGRVSQELEDGRMPIIVSRLTHDGLAWTCKVFCRLSEGDVARSGAEALWTEARWTVENLGKSPRPATLNCHVSSPHVAMGYKVAMNPKTLPYPWALFLDGPMVVDARRQARLACATEGTGRITFHCPLPQDVLKKARVPLAEWRLDRDVLRFHAELRGGQSVGFRLVVPFSPVSRESMRAALRTSFDAALARTRRYWKGVFASAGRIRTPESIVNDSYDAYLTHAMIATGRKPRSGHWILKTSPNHYEGLWGSHASIGAFSMDLCGQHDWSRKVFESFLANQGSVPRAMLELSGARASEGFADHPGFLGNIEGHMAILWMFYHGWTMWAIGQHARLTGDWAWLRRHMKKLALACEWIAVQRRRSMVKQRGRKSLAWGLLPAANAFDWGFGHMFWSDAHNYRGLREIADCLRLLKHPKAARYLAEAEAYRQDIVTSVTRSRDAAARVPLADGTSIPYVPMCAEMLEFFKTDWTYVSCGPLNLGWAGVVPADHELIEQTLAYLDAGRPLGKWDKARKAYQGWDWPARAPADEEYNSSTRPKKGRAKLWRHRMCYEPGWIPQTFTYMDRDEIPQMLEHLYSLISNGGQHVNLRSTIESRDGVPWCQPGDANLMWVMRNMLVREDGRKLLLAGSCPRAWLADGQTIGANRMPTHFGTVSFRLESRVRSGHIAGTYQLQLTRNRPDCVLLRLRHPQGKTPTRATVDGRDAQICGEWVTLPVLSGRAHKLRVAY